MSDLTVKQKEFCRLMAEGKCESQSDAYKKAFKCKMKMTSVRVAASRLMADDNIQLTIKKLSEPVDVKVRKTREEYLDLMEGTTYHDPGKMFDSHGNPLEIREMPFAERMSIAGYEFEENFTKVQKASGGSKAVPTGFTKKFKIIDRHKYAITYGKMMGFISDDPPALDLSNLSINIAFVDANGRRVDPTVLDVETHEERVSPTQPQVSFVR